ncbi:MAG: tRNA pseudouridine synthase A [Planctomycetota bacterium]
MPTYRLTIAYDGTAFSGWQKQEPPIPEADGGVATGAVHKADASLPAPEGRVALRTVQAVVEQAVQRVVREPVRLTGASRTDAGVHARGQVAAFACSAGDDPARRGGGWPVERGVGALVRALNDRLPPDALVRDARVAQDGFDPIGGAISKGYSYAFCTGAERPLFDRAFVTHTHHELDAEAMGDAARVLAGEHDFAAFTQINHDRVSTVRTIHGISVVRESPVRVRIDVSGSGFLYNMVRIIAGTLHEVGRGRMSPGDVAAALESRDRRRAGPTAGPSGLCLEWIHYPGDEENPAPA